MTVAPLVVLTERLAKYADDPAIADRLAPIHSAEFDVVWAEFCAWTLSDTQHGLMRMLDQEGKAFGELALLSIDVIGHLENTVERQWRERRGLIGALATEYLHDRLRQGESSANARAEMAAETHGIFNALLSAEAMAWAGYAAPTRHRALAVHEAVECACQASGWWSCTFDKRSIVQPAEQFGPQRRRGQKTFATAAADRLIHYYAER